MTKSFTVIELSSFELEKLLERDDVGEYGCDLMKKAVGDLMKEIFGIQVSHLFGNKVFCYVKGSEWSGEKLAIVLSVRASLLCGLPLYFKSRIRVLDTELDLGKYRKESALYVLRDCVNKLIVSRLQKSMGREEAKLEVLSLNWEQSVRMLESRLKINIEGLPLWQKEGVFLERQGEEIKEVRGGDVKWEDL
jgi:hypothetical protein